MIHVLTDSNELLEFPDAAGIKPTTSCPCPECDIACQQCSPEAQCPHSAHGTGGMCVFSYDPEKDEFQCLAYFPRSVSYAECICPPEEHECLHCQPLIEQMHKRQPGTRPAGLQSQRIRERLINSEDSTDGNISLDLTS